MNSTNNKFNITGQGLGTPEPVGVGSERAGSRRPSASDCSELTVDHQAVKFRLATGEVNPFQRRDTICRSPPRPRSASISSSKETEINQKLQILRAEPSKQLNLDENDLQTEMEFALYEEIKKQLVQSDKMYAIITSLQKELSEVKEELVALKEEKGSHAVNLRETNTISGQIDYYTDEEELSRETDWILKKGKKERVVNSSKKKRKAEFSPEVEQPSLSESKIHVRKRAQIKEQLPPPINVTGLTDYNRLHSLLKSIAGKDHKVTTLNNNVWKINVSDSDTYRSLAQKLNTEKIQWYSYENKNERPIRVMARGLHASCTIEDVQEDLRNRGYQILDAVNIIKKQKHEDERGEQVITKHGLPLFMLTFDNKENVEEIYKIKTILNMVVKIEPVRKNTKMIPQCKKCQGFNHTQAYCQKEPRCVKCAGKHLTKNCNINRKSVPKCVNCQGAHPANYRGCEVAKELQKRRNMLMKPLKEKQQLATKTRSVNEKEPGFNKESKLSTSEQKTYAQITSNGNEENDNSFNAKMLNLILGRLDEQSTMNKMIFDRLNKLEKNMGKKSVSRSK